MQITRPLIEAYLHCNWNCTQRGSHAVMIDSRHYQSRGAKNWQTKRVSATTH